MEEDVEVVEIDEVVEEPEGTVEEDDVGGVAEEELDKGASIPTMYSS